MHMKRRAQTEMWQTVLECLVGMSHVKMIFL